MIAIKKFLVVLVLAVAAMFFAPAASAEAGYLHVANAEDYAERHVFYTGSPNCNGWDRCYAWPVARWYHRENANRVHVQVRGYFRVHQSSGSNCHRNLYVGGTDSNPYIIGGTGWICVV